MSVSDTHRQCLDVREHLPLLEVDRLLDEPGRAKNKTEQVICPVLPVFDHTVMACARAIPPSALTMTTRSGGARQTVRMTKPTSTMPKSPEVLTELVQTGL